MNDQVMDRLRGVAVGAAIGDALGMPLEFCPRTASDRVVRTMQPGRLAAGAFTDDTEMALALAESLLAHTPLDPSDLATRFVKWFGAHPLDIGLHTRAVLRRVADGERWDDAAAAVHMERPENAGNGSVMRCWPVALAYWNDPEGLISDSSLQSRVTHQHPECVAGSVFVNLVIYHLIHDASPQGAIDRAYELAGLPPNLRVAILSSASRRRSDLPNSGWVRHTIESAVWGLLTTDSFEEAVAQVVSLGNDADTAGAVAGALAGAAYGLSAIPTAWRTALHGEWPIRSGIRWDEARLIALADELVAIGKR